MMAFWSKKNDPAKDKVRLLSRYTHGEGKVVLPSEAPVDVGLPSWWRDLASLTPPDRVSAALSQWDRDARIGHEMRNTISYLREHCQDVEVMRVAASYHLLYSIKNRSGGMRYYAGGNPLGARPNDAVRRLWPRVPASIQAFYDIHDGFYDYESATGFDPLAELICLDDLYWAVIDQLCLDVRVDLSATLTFLSNRAGDYLAVDAGDCENGKAVLWSSQFEPLYDQNFWDVADEWMVVFFEEE
jgi:hypothetical protein